MPKSESVLIDPPVSASTAKVPNTETGIASTGMIAARQLCKKMKTTSTTSATAMRRVISTSWIEYSTN
jgi:hypothetical protein